MKPVVKHISTIQATRVIEPYKKIEIYRLEVYRIEEVPVLNDSKVPASNPSGFARCRLPHDCVQGLPCRSCNMIYRNEWRGSAW